MPLPVSFCRASAATVLALALATGPVGTARPEEPPQALRSLTQRLVALGEQHLRRPSSALLDQVTRLAAERAALMLQLAEDDPAAVLQVALPERLAARLPAAAQAHVEERLEVEGALEVLYVDAVDPAESGALYFLNAPAFDERFQLHFAGRPPALLTGARVRARGLVLFDDANPDDDLDGAMVLEDADTSLELLDAGGSGTATATSAATAAGLGTTFGAQRTAVVLANFQNDPFEPWTVQEVDDAVFGAMSDFMFENSYRRTTVEGDVLGWFTMAVDSAACTRTTVQREADIQVANAGIDLSSYARVIYITPDTAACGWQASALLGGPVTWSNGYIDVEIIAHEFGHMLGLYHSKSLDCGAVTLGPECKKNTYGDGICTMGRDGHYNAFQKQRLGWLARDSAPLITDVEDDAVVTIGVYETATGLLPKAVRVLRNTDPASGHRTWYYLELRRPVGFDAWIASTPWAPMLDGVVLRMGTDEEGGSSLLLDATPESQPFDRYDGRIAPGAAYDDLHAGVRIAVDAMDETSATVSVTYAAPVNEPPVAGDDGAATEKRTAVTIDVLANDADPDMDPIGITAFTDGANGQVIKELNDELTYSPKPSFTGVDTFQYTLEDGFGGSAVGTVTVTVSGKSPRDRRS